MKSVTLKVFAVVAILFAVSAHAQHNGGGGHQGGNGHNGNHGDNGHNGGNGHHGNNGHNGHNGHNGNNGHNGHNGNNGGNGWNGNGGHHETSVYVRCESNSYNPAACSIPLRRVHGGYVVQQHSKSSCVEGYSYRINNRYVEVTRGCRATFLIRGIR